MTDIEKQLETQGSSINRLERVLGIYTSRSGRDFEKTMMELFKEALELLGVNPDKVKYGAIEDEKGVTKNKGLKYEVDLFLSRH